MKPLLKKIFLTIFLLLFFFTGVFQHISDSEFWPISLARLFGQFDSSHVSLYYKFFFHGLLRIPYYFELNSVQHLILARTIFSILGICTLFLYFLIAQKLYQSEKVAFALSTLLLSCIFYFSQWSRIRSDFLVLFFCLLGIYLNLSWTRQKMRIVLLAVLPFLMILTTPKAIYWIVILTIFCWPGILYVATPLFGICLLFISSSLIFGSRIFLSSYGSAFNYFFNSWSSAIENPDLIAYELGAFFKMHLVQLVLGATGISLYYLKNKNLKNKVLDFLGLTPTVPEPLAPKPSTLSSDPQHIEKNDLALLLPDIRAAQSSAKCGRLR